MFATLYPSYGKVILGNLKASDGKIDKVCCVILTPKPLVI